MTGSIESYGSSVSNSVSESLQCNAFLKLHPTPILVGWNDPAPEMRFVRKLSALTSIFSSFFIYPFRGRKAERRSLDSFWRSSLQRSPLPPLEGRPTGLHSGSR